MNKKKQLRKALERVDRVIAVTDKWGHEDRYGDLVENLFTAHNALIEAVAWLDHVELYEKTPDKIEENYDEDKNE